MSLYHYSDYRKAFHWSAKTWKQGGPGRTFLKLAKAAGVHPPYLSTVFQEKAHLNSDQLYSSLKFMGYSRRDIEFMHLLLEVEKSVHQERKQALAAQVSQLKQLQTKTESSIQAEVIAPSDDYYSRYYLDISVRLVYNFVASPRFADHPEDIAKALNYKLETVTNAISYLLDIGLLERTEKGQFKKTKTKMHLPKESHLFEAQKKLFHYRCLEHQDRTRNDSDYNFAVTFTASPEVKAQIQKKFLDFLQSIQPLVDSSEPEEVMQINFNLFNWS